MATLFPHVRAVLFDLDGTLVDSAPDLAAAVNQMRLERGLPAIPPKEYRPFTGAGARGMLAHAFGIAPEHPEFPVLREEFFSKYEEHLTQPTQMFHGVAQLLEKLLQAPLPWGIVTNKITRFTAPLVRNLQALTTASVVISGDTTPHAKPHPAPLLEAAARLKVTPQECIYVGDDIRDIQAAKAAGMGAIAASYGYLGKEQNPHHWGADAVINFPLELLQLLHKP